MKNFNDFLRDKDWLVYQNKDNADSFMYNKIPLNNRFIQIVGGYYDRSVYNVKLSLLGLYDSKEDKFYTVDWYMTNKIIEGIRVGDIYKDILDAYSKRVRKYIVENIDDLKDKGRKLYNDVMSDELNYNSYVKNVARELYIRNNTRKEVVSIVGIDENSIRECNYLDLLGYLEHGSYYIDKMLFRKLNSDGYNSSIWGSYCGSKSYPVHNMEEYIGYYLLVEEAVDKEIENLSKDKNSLGTKLSNMMKVISEGNMCTVNVTLKDGNNEITFKYPVDKFKNLYFSSYYIDPVSVRESVDSFISSAVAHRVKETEYFRDEFVFSLISQISYRGKIIYEDENLVLPF